MKAKRALAMVAAAVLGIGGHAARAEFLTAYGGPPAGPKDYRMYYLAYEVYVSDVGTAAVTGGANQGVRALRWDTSGGDATVLGIIGSIPGSDGAVFAMSANGAAFGAGEKYSGSSDLGSRAVRWDGGGTEATELGTLGTDASGRTCAGVYSANASGTAAGIACKFSGNMSLGTRAVRWDAGSTSATELGNLGTNSLGVTFSSVTAVGDGGTVVGSADKYIGNTIPDGRAVRWNAGSTAATELGNLGTNASGSTVTAATAVNAAGTAVGAAVKYSGTTYLGFRPVRWDAGSTVATELSIISTNASGVGDATPYAINAVGTAVGYAERYNGNADLGPRAVRWDGGGTAVTELGDLGTTASGGGGAIAFAVNAGGTIVGFAQKITGNTDLGQHAVLWGAEGKAIDLNTLIDPASGWVLSEADRISDSGFVVGIGTFDPDGPGPVAAYHRAFLMDVSSVVPEPSSLGLLAVAGMIQLRRLRIERRRGKMNGDCAK